MSQHKVIFRNEKNHHLKIFSAESGPGIFDWASFINVKDFYQKTYAHYFIYYCKIDHFDCREFFQRKETINGICVEFNPQNIAAKLRYPNKKRFTLPNKKIKRSDGEADALSDDHAQSVFEWTKLSLVIGYNL